MHFRAEGRQDYTTLFFVPGSRPFDLFDPDRKGRIKLYVKRIFITDDADVLPRYLRFVRGLVDSADLPLNVSREKIQESPLLAAIRKGATSRVLTEFERLADKEPRHLHENLGDLRRGAQGGHLRGFRTARRAARAGALQDDGLGRGLAQPQGLRRRAETQPDRDLLSRRRRHSAARILAAPRRVPRPRHRSAAAARSGRQFLGHARRLVRRQAVQVGDARCRRSGAHSARGRTRRRPRRRPPRR